MIIEIKLIENFLLALTAVSFVVFLIFAVNKLMKKHKQIKATEPDMSTGYKKVLLEANQHAKNLMYQTTVEAINILQGAKATNEKIEENLDTVLQGIALTDIKSLKKTTSNYEKEYQLSLQNINAQIDQVTKTVLENTQKTYNERLEKFTADLLKSAISTQETVDKKTAEMVAIAEADIAGYKKAQFEKIETDAKKLLEKIYRDVLRTSITENMQMELIMKSLEDAKKDGLFKI